MSYKKIIGIYRIMSPSNRVYIGQSVNLYKRFNTYTRAECKNQTKLFRSFKKYGVDNHVFEILEICEAHELDDKEIYYSELYNSTCKDTGLNVRDCGNGKGPLPESVKRKISQSNKGKVITAETRAKISKTLQGNTPWNKGLKGAQQAWNKGVPCGEKQKKALSELWTGRLGKESTSARVIQQLDMNGNLIAEHHGAREVERKFGYKFSGINRAARGERKTAYGYIWKYKERQRAQ